MVDILIDIGRLVAGIVFVFFALAPFFSALWVSRGDGGAVVVPLLQFGVSSVLFKFAMWMGWSETVQGILLCVGVIGVGAYYLYEIFIE